MATTINQETYLVFTDTLGNSNKFWKAVVNGTKLEVRWGRVGYQAQCKIHECGSEQEAEAKMDQLVQSKLRKGYQESAENLQGFSEVSRAVSLLQTIRSYVEQRNFDNFHYITALNNYLSLVPTPLGMKIDPATVYRSVSDVDYQIGVLNQFVVNSRNTAKQNESRPATSTTTNPNQNKAVSLKSISKSLWRFLG